MPLLCAGLGGAIAAAVVMAVPLGGDAAAHLYRTFLVNHGVIVWDNLWYGGQYPLGSYSLLYYWPAALVGNGLLVVAAVAAASGLFASVALREWGSLALGPAVVFAATAGPVPATGEYPFLLGVAAALATVALLQRGRDVSAGCCAGVALACSGLAFVFLAVALLAIAVARRTWGSMRFRIAGAVSAGLAGTIFLQFAVPWVAYPFSARDLALCLLLAVSSGLLAWRNPRARVLALFFLLWGTASVLLFVIPNPIGGDILRLREFVLPLALLAVLLAAPRWLFLAPAAIGLSIAAAVAIYQPAYVGLRSGGNRRYSLWTPALRFLRKQSTLGFRIEVVPTAGHWESYYFPRAGYALARGWYRQLDLALNDELYSPALSASQYRQWLEARAIKFVLLSHRVGLDGSGARPEAVLLSSGKSGLSELSDMNGWTIYAVPRPTPILRGPFPSRLTYFGHDRIEGWVASAGSYRMLVRYTPTWTSSPSVCVMPGRDGMSTLVARRAGMFTLASSISGLVDAHSTCAGDADEASG
jgi:hypothetical protein